MSTTYNPSANNAASYTLPSDGDPANSETVNNPLRALADKALWLDEEKLKDVVLADADVAVLASSSDAEDHPGNATNIWKPIFDFVIANGGHLRMFVGNTSSGLFALTTNAFWNPDPSGSGGQNWAKDDTSKVSRLLLINDQGVLSWSSKDAGSGTWTNWNNVANASITGDLAVGDDLTVTDDAAIGGDLTVTGAASAASLTVSGNATIPNVSGTLTATGTVTSNADFVAGGSIYATNDFESGDDIRVGGDYEYKTPLPSRTKEISLLSGQGGAINNVGETIVLSPGDALVLPIRPPHSGTLGNVRVKVFLAAASSADVDLGLYKKEASNYGATSTPSTTLVASVGTTTLTANQATNFTLADGDLTVNKNETYWLRVHNDAGSANNIEVYSADYAFADPGPRNY